MEQEEIKRECNRMYLMIEVANERLSKLRSECTHPNTFKGNYSWRVGSAMPANICSDCGSVVPPYSWEITELKYTPTH